MKFFKQQIPVHIALLTFFLGIVTTALFFKTSNWGKFGITPAAKSTRQGKKPLSARMESSEFEYIKPLLFIDREKEADQYRKLESSLTELIDDMKQSGQITGGSVYLREFDRGNWMGINEDVLYHPGSLFKVTIMLAAFHEAEKKPGFLDQSIRVEFPGDLQLPVQNFHVEHIKEGETYTVRDLLKYAISHSDNYAYWQLTQLVNPKSIDQVYLDLGMGLPQRGQDDGRVRVCAREYSKMLIALYNSTYARPVHSELGMRLMADCTFHEGMTAGLPDGTKLVHKYGEWDDTKNFELHESGIIYIGDKPYLLTIMTKGESRDPLPGAVAALTKSVYKSLSERP
ncbi:MAG: serine hydrolase, partial [Saprospiraceae bacterium]|nr:serine hydrolase [Saprospiraceae bacterium]